MNNHNSMHIRSTARRLFFSAGLWGLSVLINYVQAFECSFHPDNQSQIITTSTLTVRSFNPKNTALTRLGALQDVKIGKLECGTGNDGADWYGWSEASNAAGVKSSLYGEHNRAFWPTNIPGIYYSVRISTAGAYRIAYLPPETTETRLFDYQKDATDRDIIATIEIWQYGRVTSVGDAHPIQNGLIGTFRAGSLDEGDKEKLRINVNSTSFTVKFETPTCNFTASPTTIDFGDVGNDSPRKTFTLKNSGCVNTSGLTLKLTSTKSAYDNKGLGILANTIDAASGWWAAGGRGIAISYEHGSSRTYLSANDSNSEVSINFGDFITSKDIPMAALLTCTSDNKKTCDNYKPGAFSASGIIGATYR